MLRLHMTTDKEYKGWVSLHSAIASRYSDSYISDDCNLS